MAQKRGDERVTLYLSNLPYSASEARLYVFLKVKNAGYADSLTIQPDVSGRSGGTALITVKWRTSARMIAALDGAAFEGRILHASLEQPTADEAIRHAQAASGPGDEAGEVGEAIARIVLAGTTREEMRELLEAERERGLPRTLDVKIIRMAEARLGSLKNRPGIRKAVRTAFRRVLDALVDAAAARAAAALPQLTARRTRKPPVR